MSLPSGLPEDVGLDEMISRVLRSSSYRRKSDNGIKPAAFLPAPDHDTSVFRVAELSGIEISNLIRSYLPDKVQNGSAIFCAQVALTEGLEFVADDHPPRHANLRGWPLYETDEDRQKLERKCIAANLAEESRWLSPAEE